MSSVDFFNFRRSGEAILIPARDGDLSTFSNKEFGRGESDAAISACDEGLFACEFHDWSPVLRAG
jgi:hypothetical protein